MFTCMLAEQELCVDSLLSLRSPEAEGMPASINRGKVKGALLVGLRRVYSPEVNPFWNIVLAGVLL